jgi:tRNA(Arg) A34 adenosine deaminase TadA
VMSTASVLDNAGLNHRVVITEGVLATECALVITDFFAAKRSV